MTMPSTVRVYRSTDTGSPSLGNPLNAVVALMQAVCVDGYNPKTPISITRVGNIATVTFGSAHGYDADGYTTIRLGGADQTEYNGDFSPQNVSTNAFDIVVTGTPVTPATGVFTCTVPPLGWSIPYASSNKGVLRANFGNRLFFRVDDNNPNTDANKTANIVGYETMTDIDTGVAPFPLAAQLAKGICIFKTYGGAASGIPWIIVGDHSTINMYISHYYAGVYCPTYFGDFLPEMPSDPYGVLIAGKYSYAMSSSPEDYTDGHILVSSAATQPGQYIARAFTQIGSSIAFGKVGNYTLARFPNIGAGLIPTPSPGSNKLYCSPIIIWDGTIRGTMKGIYAPLHTRPLGNGGKLTVEQSPIGRRMLAIGTPNSSSNAGETWVDVDGPWE